MNFIKYTIFILILVFIVPSALAVVPGPYFDYVQQGGHSVFSSGFQSTTKVQRSFPGATIKVCLPNTGCSATGGTLAVLASDSTGTAKANPFTAGTDGSFKFWSNTTTFDIVFYGKGITTQCGGGGQLPCLSPFTWPSQSFSGSGSLTPADLPYILAPIPSGGDDSTSIQTIINTAAAGPISTIKFRCSTYLLASELQIPANNSFNNAPVTLEGCSTAYTQDTQAGTVFKATTIGMRSVLAVLARNTKITGVWLNANNKATSGMYLQDASWCIFTHVAATQAKVDGVFVGENSGENTFSECFFDLNGNTYATSGIVAQYTSRSSTITGTAGIVSGSTTVTITGSSTDLTTIGIRKGDFLRVGSVAATSYYGQIESVSPSIITLEVAFTQLPTTTISGQQFAIGIGDGYHHSNTTNSNINLFTYSLFRDSGGSGYGGHRFTEYGDTLVDCQLDFNNFFAASIGSADNASAVFGGAFVRPYTEGNIAGAFWLADVRDFTISSPTFPGTIFGTGTGTWIVEHKGYVETTFGAPQNFILQVTNNAGTLQHRIIGDLVAANTAAVVDRINGATFTYTNTPTVSSGAGFSAGVGILSGSANILYLDTTGPSQNASVNGICVFESNTAGAAVRVSPSTATSNINGVTKPRILFRLIDGTGAQANWNTTTIPAGTTLAIRCAINIR